jgi:formylmethanofuran dehydrogenase subunit E
MTLTEKTAYIKGLMEGLDFKADTPEKKILAAVVDLLDDLAIAVTEAEEDIEYLNDYAEELDADLGDVESDIYECDDDEDFDDEDEDDDEDYYEAVCPKCGEMIYLDDDLLECDDILCPECGEKLICELDECDGCSCCDKED